MVNIIVDNRSGGSRTDALRVAIPLAQLARESLAATAILETAGGVEFYPQSNDGTTQVYTSLPGAWANGRNTVALSESGSPSNPRFIPGSALGSRPCGGQLTLNREVLPQLELDLTSGGTLTIGSERDLANMAIIESGAASVVGFYQLYRNDVLFDVTLVFYRDSNFFDWSVNMMHAGRGCSWFTGATAARIRFGSGVQASVWYPGAWSTVTVTEVSGLVAIDLSEEFKDPDSGTRATAAVPVGRGLEQGRKIHIKGRCFRPNGSPTAAESTLWTLSKAGTLTAFADETAWSTSLGWAKTVPAEPASVTQTAAAGSAGVFADNMPITAGLLRGGNRGLSGNEYSAGLGRSSGGSDPGWMPDFGTNLACAPIWYGTWGRDEMALGAMDFISRQIHWLETDGSPVQFTQHPNLVEFNLVPWAFTTNLGQRGSDVLGMTCQPVSGNPLVYGNDAKAQLSYRAGDGKDVCGTQHFTIHQLCNYYQVFRDPSMYGSVLAYLTMLLAQHRTADANIWANFRDRAWGRWVDALLGAFDALGNVSTDLAAAVTQRLASAHQHMMGNGPTAASWEYLRLNGGNLNGGTFFVSGSAINAWGGTSHPVVNPPFHAIGAMGYYAMWKLTGIQEYFEMCERFAGTVWEWMYIVEADGSLGLPFNLQLRGVTFNSSGSITGFTSDWGTGYSEADRTIGSSVLSGNGVAADISQAYTADDKWEIWGVFAAQFCARYGSQFHPNAQRNATQFLRQYSGGQFLSLPHAHFGGAFDDLIPTGTP